MDRTVLVIDDDLAIHRLMEQHLSSGQVEVHLASDGASGLQLARQVKPDLIFLDVNMPGMDGHEVCRRLKFDPQTQGIPIAFLTACASSTDKITGLDQGAVDYIAKPFDPFEVAARTRAAFRTRSMLEEAQFNSLVDPMTGLGNRRAFDQHLGSELARAHRSAEPLLCIVLEPDALAEIARTEGQLVHDDILRDIAELLRSECREEDRVFRYTQRQFAILAPNVHMVSLMALGERIRYAVETCPAIRRRTMEQVTASLGLAISRFSLGKTVVHEAIEALLRARESGGNRVVAAGEVTSSGSCLIVV